MDVFEAIKGRRSVGKTGAESPTRAQIEELLAMAVHAPNHHLTEPWRFFVLAGEARAQLGQIMQENLREKMSETNSEKAQAALAKEQHKPLRAPVLIVVASKHTPDSKAEEIEDLEATAAATQNILLAAHAMGLATVWRTGDAAYNQRVKAWLGLEPKDHIVGIVYVGYPAMLVSERDQPAFANKTQWWGWPEE